MGIDVVTGSRRSSRQMVRPSTLGKVEIEDHEIEATALHRHESLMPVRVNRDAIVLAFQIQADAEGDVGVVFDQSDPGHSSAAAACAVCLIIFPSTR